MTLRAELDQISARTEATVDNLFARRRAGDLDEERFTKAAAAAVDKNNAQAIANANRRVAIEKAVAEKKAAVRPAGARPFSDRERLEGAVRSTATKKDGTPEDDETRRNRLKRLGRSEPYSSAQDALPKAMKAQGAKGWKRVTNPKACKLCRKWDDGKIRPPSMTMLRHPGCSCLQKPVFRGKVDKKKSRDDRGRRDRLKRLGKKAAVGAVVGGATVAATRTVTQGRTSMLAGGRRAYARLMRLERAAELGGVVAEKARSIVSIGFISRQVQDWAEKATALAKPELDRLGRIERDMAVLDGRFIHKADTQAFLDNLGRNDYTPEEIEALWDYGGMHVDPNDATRVTKGPVSRFNHPLRRRDVLAPHEQNVVELVDQAIAKNVTPRDITVFRGAELQDEFFDNWDIADDLVDESYLFTGLTEARAMPHALQRPEYPDYKPVLYEIELPKGSPAVSSPYGIGLGKGLLSRAVPIPGRALHRLLPDRVFNVRVPFLRHFNKEELVLPRQLPLRYLSSSTRDDGLRVFRMLAPKPADATRADRLAYYERIIRLTPDDERESIVARLLEIHSRPDFADLEEVEDVTAAWHKFQAGVEATTARREIEAAIAAKRREIAELKRRQRLERKETIARHPSGGSQTAAHQAEMDALVLDLERMRRTRRIMDEPTPSGGSGEIGYRITAATPRRTIAGVETRITDPGVGPPMGPDLIPDSAVKDTIARMAQVPGYEDLAGLTDRAAFEEIIRRQADQIVELAQLSMDLSPEATKIHANWYPFIHKTLNDWADATVGRAIPVTRNGSYATTAVLSPGAEWPENVAWAKRMIDAIADDVTVDAKWIKARYLSEMDLWRVEGGRRPRRRKHLEGKKLSEIVDKDGKRDDAALVYIFRGWHDFDPVKQLGGHSGFGDPRKTARPQSEVNITKAISVLYDGSLENIDTALGNGQKVRSFFSNMARPWDRIDLDVTVDTHHFGLVNGIPMTMSSKYIKSGPFNITASPDRKPEGVGGTYPLVVEATRRATDILNARWGTSYGPLQVQSITWEMWQALHPDWSRRGPGAATINAGIAKARTARALGHITRDEEKRLMEVARLAGGAPTNSEMMMIFRAHVAGEVPPNIGDVRLARDRARKARVREAKREAQRRQRDGG